MIILFVIRWIGHPCEMPLQLTRIAQKSILLIKSAITEATKTGVTLSRERAGIPGLLRIYCDRIYVFALQACPH